MSEWLDIETAPKDGRDIVVWSREHGPAFVYWAYDYRYVAGGVWKNRDHSLWAYSDASHWMPLPEPPRG